MGRPRKYNSHAERQAAYAKKQRDELLASRARVASAAGANAPAAVAQKGTPTLRVGDIITVPVTGIDYDGSGAKVTRMRQCRVTMASEETDIYRKMVGRVGFVGKAVFALDCCDGDPFGWRLRQHLRDRILHIRPPFV